MELSKDDLLRIYVAMQYAVDKQLEIGGVPNDAFTQLQDRVKDEIKK